MSESAYHKLIKEHCALQLENERLTRENAELREQVKQERDYFCQCQKEKIALEQERDSALAELARLNALRKLLPPNCILHGHTCIRCERNVDDPGTLLTEVNRLREALEKAPHSPYCLYMGDSKRKCNCWKAAALTPAKEEPRTLPDADCWRELLAAAYKTSDPPMTIFRITSHYLQMRQERDSALAREAQIEIALAPFFAGDGKTTLERVQWLVAHAEKGPVDLQLKAALAEVKRLREAIESAPHASDCAHLVKHRRSGMTYYETDSPDEQNAPWYFETGPCNCWKAALGIVETVMCDFERLKGECEGEGTWWPYQRDRLDAIYKRRKLAQDEQKGER